MPKRKLTDKISVPQRHPPATSAPADEKTAQKTRITLLDYDANQCQEKELASIEESLPFKDKPSVTWINVDGIEDVGLIEKIDTYFQIHPLVLEDIVNTTQRPKMEDYGDYLYIVFKMLEYDAKFEDIRSEQMSLIVGSNYVISFQERPGDVFDIIRERIRNNKGRIRKMGPDYLAYCLLDATVDDYFAVLEKLSAQLENVEFKLMTQVTASLSEDIHYFKREMLFLRKHIWPLREVIGNLEKSESKLIKKTTSVFLRDVYDHTIQVMDTIESYRDLLSGMQDIYVTTISNRLNEIMKVLTIISTIFMPITFIAGVYGMNFKYIAEFESPWGYPAVLTVMALAALGMLAYFKRKKWI